MDLRAALDVSSDCRRFRVVPAAELLACFASDRSHMLRPDGSWSAPPPPYPPIVAPSDGATHNLAAYWDMEQGRAQPGAPLPGLPGAGAGGGSSAEAVGAWVRAAGGGRRGVVLSEAQLLGAFLGEGGAGAAQASAYVEEGDDMGEGRGGACRWGGVGAALC